MKISNWAFQWKMRFNPDSNKQAQEVIFSRKINKTDHPPLYFNQHLVKSSRFMTSAPSSDLGKLSLEKMPLNLGS